MKNNLSIRIPSHRAPTHPGEILNEEFLIPLGISKSALAVHIHVPSSRVRDIVNQRQGVSTDTALRLAKFFGTSPIFWMNLQLRWDLYYTERMEKRSLKTIRQFSNSRAS
jgi:addiction module HigA family antidote